MNSTKPGSENTESQLSLKLKRDQYSIEIRRKKTEDALNNRRLKFAKTGGEEEEEFQEKINLMHRQELVTLFKKYVEKFTEGVKSNNTEEIYEGLIGIRRIISRPEDSPLELLYEYRILSAISNLLDDKFQEYPKIQFEAGWIITNLAGGQPKDTDYCVNSLQAIERFVTILARPMPQDPSKAELHEDLRDQAIWGLCNLSGDSDAFRNKCLEYNLVEVALTILSGATVKTKHLRNFLWLLTNLCRGKPFPPFQQISICAPFFSQIIKEIDDPEGLAYAMWGLSYLTTGDDKQIEEVYGYLDPKIVVRLSSDDTNPEIKIPAWRLVGNLLAANPIIAKELLENGLPRLLYSNLNSGKKIIRKETFWAISNILANDPEIIQWILDVNEMLPKMFYLLQNDDYEVRVEILHCFCNISACGTYEQMYLLVKFNIVSVMIKLLNEYQASTLICLALEILVNLLQAGQKRMAEGKATTNSFLLQLENEGGVKVIERLQKHPDPNVYNVIYKIIDSFFLVEGNS